MNTLRTGAISLNYANGHVQIDFKKNNGSLIELQTVELAKHSKLKVCLSHGLDSRYALLLAAQAKESVEAVTFAYIWEGNVVNADDVVGATRYAQELGVPHTVVDFDLRQILEHKLEDIGTQYRCISPQLCTHVHSIVSVADNATLVKGGELFLVGKVKDTVANPYFILDTEFKHSYKGAVMAPYYLAPFALIKDLGVAEIVPDLFMMTPEIAYQSIMHNKTVIENEGIVVDLAEENPLSNFYPYKIAFYKQLGYDKYNIPLLKNTGFETLKGHLSSLTGDYDEFNNRYRKPLRKHCAKQAWDKAVRNGVHKRLIDASEDGISAMAEVKQTIDRVDPKVCNVYYFDW